MKKSIITAASLLTLTIASYVLFKPAKNSVCDLLAFNNIASIRNRCLTLLSSISSAATLIPVSENRLKAEPVLAVTAKPLALAPLKCARAPASDLVVNVKDHGAKGDGVNNDTPAIQTSVELVKNTGGTVLVPEGTYLIDAVSHIQLRDHMTFKMEPGATLKAMPNNKENFSLIKIRNVTDINVIGGILQGERHQHQGQTGEWGMGLEINGGKNVVIEKVISKENWGDGFYVSENATNILFCDVVADNNRRQGMSVVSADGVIIKDSVFQRTNGYPPMSGLDVEPNADSIVNNIQIIGSQFLQNKGSGISFTMEMEHFGKSFIKNGLIDGNLIANNGSTEGYLAGITFYYQNGIRVTNNMVRNNLLDGMSLNTGSTANQITGNSFIENGRPENKKYGRGIFIYQANKNVIENNTVNNNLGYDIHDYAADNTIRNNNAKNVKIGPAP